MKQIFYLVLFLLFNIATALAQQEAIPSYLSKLPSGVKVSMKVQTADGEVLYEQNANQQIPSASIIKVPILVALMRQVEGGRISWKAPYQLQATDKVGGSGVLQQVADGTTFRIADLALEMIRSSDNTATNILIRKVGMDKVNQLLAALELEQTTLQRLMMDFDAIQEGRQNYTSAADMNRLFVLLSEGKLLSKKWTKKAMNILTQCADATTIPSLLPAKVKVAHKTGTLDYVRGDTGIIFLKKHPIVLSIFVENFTSFEQAAQIIGALAKLVYDSQADLLLD